MDEQGLLTTQNRYNLTRQNDDIENEQLHEFFDQYQYQLNDQQAARQAELDKRQKIHQNLLDDKKSSEGDSELMIDIKDRLRSISEILEQPMEEDPEAFKWQVRKLREKYNTFIVRCDKYLDERWGLIGEGRRRYKLVKKAKKSAQKELACLKDFSKNMEIHQMRVEGALVGNLLVHGVRDFMAIEDRDGLNLFLDGTEQVFRNNSPDEVYEDGYEYFVSGRTKKKEDKIKKGISASRLANYMGIEESVQKADLLLTENDDGKLVYGMKMDHDWNEAQTINELKHSAYGGFNLVYSPEALKQLSNIRLLNLILGRTDMNEETDIKFTFSDSEYEDRVHKHHVLYITGAKMNAEFSGAIADEHMDTLDADLTALSKQFGLDKAACESINLMTEDDIKYLLGDMLSSKKISTIRKRFTQIKKRIAKNLDGTAQMNEVLDINQSETWTSEADCKKLARKLKGNHPIFTRLFTKGSQVDGAIDLEKFSETYGEGQGKYYKHWDKMKQRIPKSKEDPRNCVEALGKLASLVDIYEKADKKQGKMIKGIRDRMVEDNLNKGFFKAFFAYRKELLASVSETFKKYYESKDPVPHEVYDSDIIHARAMGFAKEENDIAKELADDIYENDRKKVEELGELALHNQEMDHLNDELRRQYAWIKTIEEKPELMAKLMETENLKKTIETVRNVKGFGGYRTGVDAYVAEEVEEEDRAKEQEEPNYSDLDKSVSKLFAEDGLSFIRKQHAKQSRQILTDSVQNDAFSMLTAEDIRSIEDAQKAQEEKRKEEQERTNQRRKAKMDKALEAEFDKVYNRVVKERKEKEKQAAEEEKKRQAELKKREEEEKKRQEEIKKREEEAKLQAAIKAEEDAMKAAEEEKVAPKAIEEGKVAFEALSEEEQKKAVDKETTDYMKYSLNEISNAYNDYDKIISQYSVHLSQKAASPEFEAQLKKQEEEIGKVIANEDKLSPLSRYIRTTKMFKEDDSAVRTDRFNANLKKVQAKNIKYLNFRKEMAMERERGQEQWNSHYTTLAFAKKEDQSKNLYADYYVLSENIRRYNNSAADPEMTIEDRNERTQSHYDTCTGQIDAIGSVSMLTEEQFKELFALSPYWTKVLFEKGQKGEK